MDILNFKPATCKPHINFEVNYVCRVYIIDCGLIVYQRT